MARRPSSTRTRAKARGFADIRVSAVCTSSISTARSPARARTKRPSTSSGAASRRRCSSAAASATAHDRQLAREGRRPRHPRHRRGARPGARARGGEALSGADRGRPRRPARQGGDRRLARDVRTGRARHGEELRGRRGGGDRLHRHSIATGCSRASTGRRRSRSPTPSRVPVIASGGLASMADIERLTRPTQASLPAPSPVARSMTGASIRPRRCR